MLIFAAYETICHILVSCNSCFLNLLWGSGVNFVSYCCGVCEKEGVEALLEAKCCEIHGHDHSRDKLANNTVECCGMNGCGIERVDFDWNSVNIQVPDLQPVVHDLLFSSIFESLQIASLFADSYEIR